MAEYVTLDSGERQNYDSGMRRDTQAGKPRYDLIDRSFLRRWAELMGRGAEKYGERNWELANSQEELNRFKASALRHMMQWLDGDETEDHAAAVAFNVAAVEFVKGKTNEALDEGYEKLAEDLLHRPQVGGLINPGFGEPCTDGVYKDRDGDLWEHIGTGWNLRIGEPYAVSWQEVEKTWSFTFPWERIS